MDLLVRSFPVSIDTALYYVLQLGLFNAPVKMFLERRKEVDDDGKFNHFASQVSRIKATFLTKSETWDGAELLFLEESKVSMKCTRG